MDGMDGIEMAIIGHRSSKSTFGANNFYLHTPGEDMWKYLGIVWRQNNEDFLNGKTDKIIVIAENNGLLRLHACALSRVGATLTHPDWKLKKTRNEENSTNWEILAEARKS